MLASFCSPGSLISVGAVAPLMEIEFQILVNRR